MHSDWKMEGQRWQDWNRTENILFTRMYKIQRRNDPYDKRKGTAIIEWIYRELLYNGREKSTLHKSVQGHVHCNKSKIRNVMAKRKNQKN